jgi:hypothetical protein
MLAGELDDAVECQRKAANPVEGAEVAGCFMRAGNGISGSAARYDDLSAVEEHHWIHGSHGLTVGASDRPGEDLQAKSGDCAGSGFMRKQQGSLPNDSGRYAPRELRDGVLASRQIEYDGAGGGYSGIQWTDPILMSPHAAWGSAYEGDAWAFKARRAGEAHPSVVTMMVRFSGDVTNEANKTCYPVLVGAVVKRACLDALPPV